MKTTSSQFAYGPTYINMYQTQKIPSPFTLINERVLVIFPKKKDSYVSTDSKSKVSNYPS